jgi:glycosyltransferase involved in cell wall biosynthesis
MKISVITVTYNSAQTLEDTIKSVVNQTYPDIEYIIVDGLSKDDTLNIVKKYEGKIAKVVSEKDNGIYDAINKGVDLATGEVVAILNSDDLYNGENVIAQIMKTFAETNADAVYGDLVYVERTNIDKITRTWNSGKYKEGKFIKGWMPPHPSFFVKRWCYKRFGKFHTTFKTSADYELMLRFIHVNKIKLAYVPEVLVRMRLGGQSNVSLANRLEANREDRKAWEMNGLKPGRLTLIRKPLSKIFQFFK